MFELGNEQNTLSKCLDVPVGTAGTIISRWGLNQTIQTLPQNDCPSRLCTWTRRPVRDATEMPVIGEGAPVNHIKSSAYHWPVGEGGTKDLITPKESHKNFNCSLARSIILTELQCVKRFHSQMRPTLSRCGETCVVNHCIYLKENTILTVKTDSAVKSGETY